MGQLLLCLRVTSTIQLIDPLTLQLREVMGSHYWNEPFYSILDSKRLVTVSSKFLSGNYAETPTLATNVTTEPLTVTGKIGSKSGP